MGALLVLALSSFAANDGERLARLKARFEKSDALLNLVYAKARAEVGPERTLKLREAQRAWLERRDEIATVNAGKADRPERLPEFWESKLASTEGRIAFLRIYSGRDVARGIAGHYDDGQGGSLTLKQTKRGLDFHLEVVRGPTAHTGDLAGTAELRGDVATFHETLAKGEEPRELAQLKFRFVEGHIVRIEAKNAGYHLGMRAYFDGDYYKTATP